ALAGLAQIRAGRDDDAPAEQALGARLGGLLAPDLDPEVHRRPAAGNPPAPAAQDVEQDLALARVDGARLHDVLLVAPGDDGGPLDELLGRAADGRAVLLERRDHLGRSRDESGAIARHRRALAERVEDDD